MLFAFGIIGTGLLAVPVLAGSAAYAVSEMLGRPASLDSKPLKARLFYGTIAVTTLAGALASVDRGQPVQRALLERGHQRRAGCTADARDDADCAQPVARWGYLTLSRRGAILGWSATAVMVIATALFFVSLF